MYPSNAVLRIKLSSMQLRGWLMSEQMKAGDVNFIARVTAERNRHTRGS
jgi:hypothetical protein